MAPWIRRLHLLELNDQSWVPQAVRSRVQTCLTLLWTLRLPLIQPQSPAALVSSTLRSLLGHRIQRYTFIDFCAGAGGPTPTIERELNRQLLASAADSSHVVEPRQSRPKQRPESSTPTSPTGGLTNGSSHGGGDPVDFVLTDINPHRAAWASAAMRSPYLHYVSRPVDAAAAPADLLQRGVTISPRADAAGARDRLRQRAAFRLFALAFHHMPDHEARDMLRDAMAHADGFGIFELQGRTLGECVLVLLIWPLLLLVAPFYFADDPTMLFLIYVVPAVPFVLVCDGLVSCLRTRTSEEILTLIRDSGADAKHWRLREGRTMHTWPLGYMRWYVGVRE